MSGLCAVVLWVLLLLVCVGGAGAQSSPQPTGELTVFAAASLTEAFREIAQHMESIYPGLKILYNFGGSPTLRTQIEQGAHADIFASADATQMDLAQKSGVIQGERPVFVKNRLVIIVPSTNPGKVTEFRDLARPGLKLDLTAPQVPVGNYSRQAIHKASADYGADFERRVLSNLVSEEGNVKQVVTKVQLGEADAGIVYVSDVTPQVRTEVLTVPIPDTYNQIATYPIALTQRLRNRPAAEAFMAFVLSSAGRAILKVHNFIPVEE
jgi:molybdate transport system substrate-binding protein